MLYSVPAVSSNPTIPLAERSFPTPRENFPVAGWFIARPLRPAVQAYYNFARRADDIADSASLSIIAKLSGLDALESALNDGSALVAQAFQRHQLPMSLAADLLTAFRRDARNQDIATVDELLDYCRFSANPVGRFLLALHGEQAGGPEADALSSALQILNHVQDAREDAEQLRRCYIPNAWLKTEGVDRKLLVTAPAETAPAAVARCLDRMLDEARRLLTVAAPLPSLLAQPTLAAQSAAILTLARRLLARLQRSRPWDYRISLAPLDWAAAALRGLFVRGFGS